MKDIGDKLDDIERVLFGLVRLLSEEVDRQEFKETLKERIESMKKTKITCGICGRIAPSVFTHWFTLAGIIDGEHKLTSICDVCFERYIRPLLKKNKKKR